jgi:hypothetical protein
MESDNHKRYAVLLGQQLPIYRRLVFPLLVVQEDRTVHPTAQRYIPADLYL